MSEDTSSSQAAGAAVHRRAFIGAVGAAGAIGLAAGAVAGCTAAASPGAGTGGGSAPQGAGGTGTALVDPAPTGASQLGSVAGVAVGAGKVFASPPVVVTHPEAGQFKAFSGVCTHSGCKLSEVKDGEIICPCHGARFSAATGAVLKGPATIALPAVPITVENDIASLA